MAQSTIDTFFANRKRHAADDLKGKSSKIIALDSDSVTAGYGRAKSNEISGQTATRIKVEATVTFSNDDAAQPKPQRTAVSTPLATKARTPARTTRRATKAKDTQQTDMKTFLRSVVDAKSESETKIFPAASPVSTSNEQVSQEQAPAPSPAPAPVEEPAPVKDEPVVEEKQAVPTSCSAEMGSHVKPEAVEENGDSIIEKVAPQGSGATPARKESNIERARKELSLGDIKSKLTRSARLAELKASLARFDEGRNKLNKIEQAKQTLQDSNSPRKQLAQFSSIQLEVPVSPSKSPMKSPMKSPLKSLAGSRSPAFQRYSSLAQTEKLPLPQSYRHLAELFRCMEGVVSMYFNRKEVITFKKLQPSVQNMGHKTFTLNHLAQIVSVFPEAYTLKQEKVHSFGSPTKGEKYNLVILPVIKSESNNSDTYSMAPSVMNERQQRFFRNLLELVKKHHQDFLQSLDPPIVIPTGMLTRWHPEFAVDQVPDLPRAPLPQPPNLEKCSSAKDVLAKARQLISCNPRMEKALSSIALSNSGAPKAVDEVKPPTQNPPVPGIKNTQLLKGIPNSLLEKIRAKQAAKAMEAMTRTSEQDIEATQYSRLPEIARIMRCVFVTEKKSSLPLDFVLEKVNNSYRSSLSRRELEDHIKLLAKAVPGWVSFDFLLKTEYLRLSKKGDMNRVMDRLNELASSK